MTTSTSTSELAKHIGHRLTLKDDARTLRCVDCTQNVVLSAALFGPAPVASAPRQDQRCPTHIAGWLDACAGCAADAKAAYEAPVLPLPDVHGPADVRALLAARKPTSQEPTP